MNESTPTSTESSPPGPASSSGWSRRRIARVVSLAVWVGVIAWQGYSTIGSPNELNLITTVGFVLLFAVAHAQIFLVRWLGERRLNRALARMHGNAYLSELDSLPNRNYLLSELRREMPRARSDRSPFVLILLSMDTLDEVRERRGEEFADRALKALAQVLKRFTRTSDFIAHLGGPDFCVMLNECEYDNAFIYLQRVPGSIAVSDGHRMYEIPVSARVHQYDLENLYATDVLRDAEETTPLKRKMQQHFGSEAA